MTTGEENLNDRNKLVIDHVALVKAMASRLARRLPAQVDVVDLIGVGVVGLIEAAQRFRPSTGVSFDAFARQRLRGAMLDALRDLDWAPRSLRRAKRQIDSSVMKLRHELGREPNEEEIAGDMGMSTEECERLLEQVRSLELGSVRQLEAPSQDGTLLIDICVDPGEGPEVTLERGELREHLAAALESIPVRERQVLAMYYQEEMTLAEIGAVLGVTESRVSQIRSLAISRLRTLLRDRLRLPNAA